MSRPTLTIALIDWFHLYEDFLDSIGVSFEAFRDEMTGGWLFGYVEAMQRCGMRPILFYVSARVTEPLRFVHAPSGADVRVLPAPASYRMVRGRLLNPSNYYAPVAEERVGGRIRRMTYALRKDVAPYLATPLRSLARELRREGCDAILCQEYEHARFDTCVLLGRLLQLPVFATFQGGDTRLSRIEHPVRPFTMRACSGLVIAPGTELQRVRTRYGISPTRIAQIFNPLDLDQWRGSDPAAARRALNLPPSARVAVWHGRVDIQRKGLDVLLTAWEQVCGVRAGRDLRLLLVGSGSDADDLRRRIASTSGLGIRWVDEYVRDRNVLRLYLSAADVYVLPSRHEGFPVAPIEAMACGLPVVAADASGIADIIADGNASGGIIVPRGNPSALARALGDVLDDEAWGRELGERARQRAESAFALETVGEQLREFLLRAMPQTPPDEGGGMSELSSHSSVRSIEEMADASKLH